MRKDQHKFISFFAGARGLDIGLEAAGLQCLAANEIDPIACRTIRDNKPRLKVYSEDIRNLSARRLIEELGPDASSLFAIVGGPPCQAFSTAGKRLGLADERGNVFLHFIDLITELQPKYAVFENVRGLLSAPLKHRPHNLRGENNPPLRSDEKPGGALRFILNRLRRRGYVVTFNLYNTANFGVPQARERLIFFASRDGQPIPHLVPTHSKDGAHGLPRWKTLRDAFSKSYEIEHHALDFPQRRRQYYKLLSEGENWRSLPKDKLSDAMGKSLQSGGGRTGFYRRLAWDKPSPTLVTRPNMMATDLCHPEEIRPLSVEEYAMIQTFPREYRFAGKLDDQYRQIGNAVPCIFGTRIGEHLVKFDEGKLPMMHVASGLSRYKRTDEVSWQSPEKIGLFSNLHDLEVA